MVNSSTLVCCLRVVLRFRFLLLLSTGSEGGGLFNEGGIYTFKETDFTNNKALKGPAVMMATSHEDFGNVANLSFAENIVECPINKYGYDNSTAEEVTT